MVTDSLTKKYTQIHDEVIKTNLTEEAKSLINKFDSRYKMQINQHFSLQNNYFPKTLFTKNQRNILYLFLKISSAWFCYEILILICKEFDAKCKTKFLTGQNRKGGEFRIDFLKKSDFILNSKNIIIDFHSQTIKILDKVANNRQRTLLIAETKDYLSILLEMNKKIDKKDYNFAIENFSKELAGIENTYKHNYKKIKKNKEEFVCKYINFKSFIGLCYIIRNQYVHNGLTYNPITNNNKTYVENLQNIHESLNHLVLSLAISIFKNIIENSKVESNN